MMRVKTDMITTSALRAQPKWRVLVGDQDEREGKDPVVPADDALHKPAPPSLLGIAEFIVPTGSFFHAQTHVSFHIIEELSPNVRMIPPSVLNEEGVRRNILQWIVLGFDTFEEQIVGFCSVLAGRDAYGACHLQMICT